MSAAERLILASSSPQRKAILKRLEVSFQVRPSAVSELTEGEPGQVTLHNALRKARAVAMGAPDELLLGCDTVVSLDGVIYGKPTDERHALKTLRVLSGTTHTVFSSLALIRAGGEELTATVRTEVSFRELSEETLDWYVAKQEWRGRAGGYAIQGAGAALVREIHGDYENVVGLPLTALLDLYPRLLGV